MYKSVEKELANFKRSCIVSLYFGYVRIIHDQVLSCTMMNKRVLSDLAADQLERSIQSLQRCSLPDRRKIVHPKHKDLV